MVDAENGWRDFLGNNTDFILPLDYIRDMAVEQPGDSPVLMAKFGDKGTAEDVDAFIHSAVSFSLKSLTQRTDCEGSSRFGCGFVEVKNIR